MGKTRIKIGILATCTCCLTYMAYAPVLPTIMAAFPETPQSLIQMMITLPSLMFIFFSPLAGKLTQFIMKKKLAIIGVVLYMIGGLLPFFLHTAAWQLLLGSVIIGCGSGLMMPLINLFICDYFDEKERGQLMGLNATFVAVGCMALMFVSGRLSRFGWYYSSLTFLLLIPVLLLMIFCLPQGIMHPPVPGSKSTGFEMNGRIAFLFAIGTLYFTVQNAFNTNAAMVLAEIGLPNADMASAVTMANTLGGVAAGMVFGFLAQKLPRQIETLALGMSAVGFLLGALVHAFPAMVLSGLLVGAAFAIFNAAGTLLLCRILKPENNAFTVGIYLGVVNAGAALSPLVVNNCSALFGSSIVTRFLFSGIVLAVGCVISLVASRKA